MKIQENIVYVTHIWCFKNQEKTKWSPEEFSYLKQEANMTYC